MEREVRYCTTEDGMRIAYCLEGEGPPLLVHPFFVESFALEYLVPEHAEFMRQLGAGRMLIRFDGRGQGLAQAVAELSLDTYVLDIEAVVRAAGVTKPAAWGAIGTRGGENRTASRVWVAE